MKTTLPLLSLLLAGPLFGQGVVTFHNDSASAVTNAVTGDRAAAGGAFQAALYYAPHSANAPDPSTFMPTGTAIAIEPAGYFIGPNVTLPASIQPGGDAWLQVRVWEVAYGASYEQAIAAAAINGRVALRGTSPILRVRTTFNNLSMPLSLTGAGLPGIVLDTGMPQLRITRVGGNAIISWSSADATFRLEQSSNLPAAAGSWTTVPNAPVVNGHERTVTVDATAPSRFYRLVSP